MKDHSPAQDTLNKKEVEVFAADNLKCLFDQLSSLCATQQFFNFFVCDLFLFVCTNFDLHKAVMFNLFYQEGQSILPDKAISYPLSRTPPPLIEKYMFGFF